jgi:Mg/Co/Ni transporter MgtE
VDGKLDWLATGLPTEGTNTERPRAGDLARRDVPTCRVDEPFAEVRDRVRAAGWDACVVANEERVVFGLLRESELDADSDGPVQNAMRRGPSTFRPHVPVEEMAHFMQQHDLASSPITSSDGRLISLLRSDDAIRAAHELHAQRIGHTPGDAR